MGSYVLRGVTTALFVTALTLIAGILWSAMGLGGLSISQLVDIGLLASCLAGGYRTAKESREWFMGGVAGAGYVLVGTLLLALFLPIRGLGFIQVLVEGTIIGLVAGAFGAGKKTTQSFFTPSYAGNNTDTHISSNFDWEEEEIKSSKLNWIEGSEEDFHEVPERKRNSSVDDAVIEWPWDRVNKNAAKEAKQVGNDLVVVGDKDEEKAKPWWEQ